VEGKTVPLLGTETLMSESIEATATGLLERRGFEIVETGGDLLCKILYQTTAGASILENTMMRSNTASTSWASTSGRSARGLGVIVARTLGSAGVSTEQSTVSGAGLASRYDHILAIEIVNPQQVLLWKGEAAWVSANLDLRADLATGLQVLFSQLPYDPGHLPSGVLRFL
jgi:hypothetical protein